MSILTLVGARPQFIKAAMVSRALKAAGLREVLVHSGQHYDHGMSRVFFEELGIPEPDADLGVGSGSHARQTGAILERLERICAGRPAKAMVVYGDTNTTLAGALVSAKLGIPLAHVEAGLRSFDRRMPEEVNRVVCDRLSRWLFCPTATAAENLAREGMTDGVHRVGDVMYDAALHFGRVARETRGAVLDRFGVRPGRFVLATIHRDFNADRPERLRGIVEGLAALDEPVVFPAHPRVRGRIDEFGLRVILDASPHVRLAPPAGFLDMVALEGAARAIVTDSGGVQKEALFHRVPCVTVRPSTEWVETVTSGWNRLADADRDAIVRAVRAAAAPAGEPPDCFGDGRAAERIAAVLAAGGL